MRVSHKVDYGVRVMTRLAEADAATPARPVTRSVLAAKDDLPPNFLDDILRLLRNANLVRSQRGGEGGWPAGQPSARARALTLRALPGSRPTALARALMVLSAMASIPRGARL